MKTLLYLAVLCVAVFGAILGTAWALQRQLIYQPDRERVLPGSLGLAGVEELVIATPDGHRIVAWWSRPAPGRPTLLYFHGNGGSLAARADRIAIYRGHGLGVLMMTYRGYGGSTGAPSEAANFADAMLTYDTLIGFGVRPGEIVAYGESLGTGVATYLAATKPVGGLVLDAPFTSMTDMGSRAYPWLPVTWVLTDRYDTIDRIGRVTAPVLILHGESDPLIPVAMGQAVYDAAREPKAIITMPGGTHSDLHRQRHYGQFIAWLSDLPNSAANGAKQKK